MYWIFQKEVFTAPARVFPPNASRILPGLDKSILEMLKYKELKGSKIITVTFRKRVVYAGKK